MLTLVLTLCLNTTCREARITAPPDLSPIACLMGAQQTAVRYLAEHPQLADWRLRGARCEVGRQSEA